MANRFQAVLAYLVTSCVLFGEGKSLPRQYDGQRFAQWQASLRIKGVGHQCSGSLITERWVLTAAQCSYFGGLNLAYYPEDVTVVLGSDTLFGIGYLENEYDVDAIWDAPQFAETWQEKTNDISLWHLSQDVHFVRGLVEPIYLPWNGESIDDMAYDQDFFYTSGWPYTIEPDFTIFPPNVLTITEATRAEKYCPPELICTVEEFEDTYFDCNVDPGSPLVTSSNGTWMQVGIVVSTGVCKPFGDSNTRLVVSTNVGEHIQGILRVLDTDHD